MTGLLQDLMHDRADSLDAPDLDLTSITRAGERRVRRRRTTWAGGIAAAAVAAFALATSLPGGGSGGRDDLVADGTDAAPVALAWVIGSTLHRVDLPEVGLAAEVRSWVRAGDAVVYAGTDRTVHVWKNGEDTEVGAIGRTPPDEWDLVADGDRAWWYDPEAGLTSLDVTSGTTRRLPARVGQGVTPRVTAADGTQVFAVDARGVFSWEVTTGAVSVIQPDPSAATVMDAEGAVMVRGSLEHGGKVVITTPATSVEVASEEYANISPDGRLVATTHDDTGFVVDAATGRQVPFEHGHEWAIGYEWLDDTTLAVMAFDGLEEGKGASTALLVTCDGTTGQCLDGPKLPSDLGSFQLPIGVHFSE